ncbi:MAG: hypothetical protein J6H21_05645 [Firmicutes bacterium]|nr:hypothetical protein [Bacillota bacterium]
MNSQMIIEIVGYIGSALVLVSFLMTSVWKLRIVNTIGSFIFMIYALIIRSYPTAIMNFCLVLINLHFLWKMRHTGKEYDLVKLEPSDQYLKYLLKKQGDDIEKFFPHVLKDFQSGESELDFACLITCGGNPAGITMGKQKGEELDLHLDYSLPEYRDFSIGTFLMNKLKEEGIKKLIYDGPSQNHMAYLNKMGFKEVQGVFEKTLA